MKQFRKKKKSRLLPLFILFIMLLLAVFVLFEVRLTPVLASMAESRAKNIATSTVNDAVQQVLCADDMQYENFVDMTVNESGVITAVTVDSIRLNRLCAEIRGMITEVFSSMGEKTVSIPVGTLTGIDLLTGKGPRIQVALTVSGSAVTKIVNDFQTAGINQTRHQMILEVQTKVYALTQHGTFSSEITNSIVIAETVIVGQVPEIYSDGGDDLWENLIEY